MPNRLNPELIYEKFLKKEISKNESLKLLESLINESDNEEIRANAIEVLEQFSSIGIGISKLIEKSLISDESPLVRTAAAKFIINTNLEEAENALEWRIQNEKSILFFKKSLDFTKHSQIPEIKKFKEKLLVRLSKIYNLNKPDSEFILELDYHDYKEFVKDFKGFLSKFEIKQEERKKIIKENTEIRYKGLGRITSAREGYITGLILNDLEEVPKSLQNLSKLEYLEINRCKVGDLTDSYGYLSQIKNLTLKNNEIELIPHWVLDISSTENYIEKYVKNGVKFDGASILGLLEILAGQTFVKLELETSFFPSLLFYYKINQNGNVIAIHLSSELSRIGIFPKEICKLRFLEELCMVNQNIKSIPNCIGELRALKTLNLSFNKINEIPNSIGNLENLEYLYLKNHEGEQILNHITENLINLRQLKILDLSGNIIKNLPESIQNLKSLKT
jgi:Leucine-rich repeat (LRR) protein